MLKNSTAANLIIFFLPFDLLLLYSRAHIYIVILIVKAFSFVILMVKGEHTRVEREDDPKKVTLIMHEMPIASELHLGIGRLLESRRFINSLHFVLALFEWNVPKTKTSAKKFAQIFVFLHFIITSIAFFVFAFLSSKIDRRNTIKSTDIVQSKKQEKIGCDLEEENRQADTCHLFRLSFHSVFSYCRSFPGRYYASTQIESKQWIRLFAFEK